MLTTAPSTQTPVHPARAYIIVDAIAPAAAGRIEQHVAADEACMCIGPRAENHALVDDVDGLPADIEQHDADDQPCDRRIAERERQPRTREQHERGAGRRFAAPAIREPARAGGGCRTSAPTRPNAPICVCDIACGGALSGSTSALQKMLKAANISSAIAPRTRSTRSSRNSDTIDCSSAA